MKNLAHLLLATLALTFGACSLLNVEGPILDCSQSGVNSACANGIVAVCTNGVATYRQCGSNACSAAWQIPNAFRCAATEVVPCPNGGTACCSYYDCANGDTGGTCVDTASDMSNCGACGNACTDPGQICVLGACACPTGQKDCNGTCTDTETDTNNCGACGNGCASALCASGKCVCADKKTMCDSGCVDVTSDDSNCGACGHACPDGSSCTNSSCECTDTTLSMCDGACVSLTTDANNCGLCGSVCGYVDDSGHANCLAGQCAEFPTNGTCATAASVVVTAGVDEVVVGDTFGAPPAFSCQTGCSTVSGAHGVIFRVLTPASAGTLTATVSDAPGMTVAISHGACSDSGSASTLCGTSSTSLALSGMETAWVYVFASDYQGCAFANGPSAFALTLHFGL